MGEAGEELVGIEAPMPESSATERRSHMRLDSVYQRASSWQAPDFSTAHFSRATPGVQPRTSFSQHDATATAIVWVAVAGLDTSKIQRHAGRTTVETTNLAFADWHTVFPSATCATALVERVVHHADIVKIDGKSYRLRESEADANSRRASPPQKKPSNNT